MYDLKIKCSCELLRRYYEMHNHTLSTQLSFAQREMTYGGTVLIMKVILHNTKN